MRFTLWCSLTALGASLLPGATVVSVPVDFSARVTERLATPRAVPVREALLPFEGRVQFTSSDFFYGCGGSIMIMEDIRIPAPRPGPWPGPAGLIELYGSVENFETAWAARRVEVWQLAPIGDDDATARYAETQQLSVMPEDGHALRVLLTFDGSFDWNDDLDWTPRYTHRVKFVHHGRTVSIDLSLGPRMLRVRQDDRTIAVKNFDHAADPIQQIIDRSEAWTRLSAR